MYSSLDDVLSDASLTVDDRVAETARYLVSLPDRGVAEVLRFLTSSVDAAKASYAANYLALLPHHGVDKARAVQYLTQEHPELAIAAVNLIKDMPDHVLDVLLPWCLEAPPSSDLYSILYEIARFFPAKLHAHMDGLSDPVLRAAALPGLPDEWVQGLSQEYLDTANTSVLSVLARVRTDAALEELLRIERELPVDRRDEVRAFIENAGVFTDTREPSVFSRSYRGFVVRREESPHHMGGGFLGPVPKCPVCDVAADRILTLDAGTLGLELTGEVNPSFFWYQCPHPPSHVVVRVKKHGVEGLMTPMADGEERAARLPEDVSLLLVDNPSPLGFGVGMTPGYSWHQVGGFPPWVELSAFPTCPGCGHRMRFLASIDSGMTPFGPIQFSGMLYGFWCEHCSISATTCQQA